MIQGSQPGTALDSLTLKVGGETLSPSGPAVLSCGGVFFPRQKLPLEFRTWRQIVNLPGNELSAKIYGFESVEVQESLQKLLQKDSFN